MTSSAKLDPTPWQTIGPYFHFALPWRGCADLVEASQIGPREDLYPRSMWRSHVRDPYSGFAGERIKLRGRVLDSKREAVPDALLEIWQAGPAPDGAVDEDIAFIGFGRSATSTAGEYEFRTLMPAVRQERGRAAPFLTISIFAPGLTERLITRVYLEDALADTHDPLLSLVPPSRRATLMAQREASDAWRFDIVLSGPAETVFFRLEG